MSCGYCTSSRHPVANYLDKIDLKNYNAFLHEAVSETDIFEMASYAIFHQLILFLAH